MDFPSEAIKKDLRRTRERKAEVDSAIRNRPEFWPSDATNDLIRQSDDLAARRKSLEAQLEVAERLEAEEAAARWDSYPDDAAGEPESDGKLVQGTRVLLAVIVGLVVAVLLYNIIGLFWFITIPVGALLLAVGWRGKGRPRRLGAVILLIGATSAISAQYVTHLARVQDTAMFKGIGVAALLGAVSFGAASVLWRKL